MLPLMLISLVKTRLIKFFKNTTRSHLISLSLAVDFVVPFLLFVLDLDFGGLV